MKRPPIREALGTGFALRCPRCGKGRLFRGWLEMRRECPACKLPYYRESGYFLGAMILNYGFTAAVVLAAYLATLALRWEAILHTTSALFGWMGFGVSVSLLLMRHAYSLWLSLDYWLEPWSDRGTGE